MEYDPLVLDIGTQNCKIGFAAETQPKFVLPWHPRHDRCSEERGMQYNKELMTELLDDVFYSHFHFTLLDFPLLVSLPSSVTTTNKKQIVELLFEHYCIPYVYLANQQLLTLNATGRTSGIVVDIGHGCSHIVPIVDGIVQPQGVSIGHIAGIDISLELSNELFVKECGRSLQHDANTIEAIKRQLCYAAPDYYKELHRPVEDIEAVYTLPTGQSLHLSRERFVPVEILFNPSVAGLEGNSLQKDFMSTLSRVGSHSRTLMTRNVVLSGGTTLIRGFDSRFCKELAQQGANCRFTSPSDRLCGAWIGASILASDGLSVKDYLSLREFREGGTPLLVRHHFF